MAPQTVGVHRARAWLTTVINPLLQTLPIEQGCLEREQWTWRFQLRRCELLHPCIDIVGPTYAPNLDDLVEREASIGEVIAAHDVALEALVEEFQRAQAELESDPGFKAAVDHAREEHAKTHPGDRPWGALKPAMLLPLTAQFVLNHVDPELARASDSTMAEFWAHRHATLSPFGTRLVDRLRTLASRLLETVLALMSELKASRRRLCDLHDLPPIPID